MGIVPESQIGLLEGNPLPPNIRHRPEHHGLGDAPNIWYLSYRRVFCILGGYRFSGDGISLVNANNVGKTMP